MKGERKLWEGGSGRGKCKGGGAGEVGKLRQNQGAQLVRIAFIIKVGTVRYSVILPFPKG